MNDKKMWTIAITTAAAVVFGGLAVAAQDKYTALVQAPNKDPAAITQAEADLQTAENAVDKAQQRSRNYAKRQLTWFRHQLPASKIDVASFDEAINLDL